MHQQSLQGATQTPQDGALWRSRPRSGPPLWAWLLLGVLMVPGARSFLSEEKEEMLVELHNYYRGQVSPSASAMMPLKWDPALKLIAEGYAAKCIWNHNPELEDTGENLFAGTGSLDLREALEKWFLERLDYNFQNNSCHEDKMCGHYTQMVWADTHRVGCAFHLCNTMEGLDWERASFLVCNYFPAGNYEGERPYVEGDWCSRCPENLLRCENNLCVADVEEEDDEEDATVVPPPATSEPSLKAEEEESAADVQPGTTAAPSTTSTTSRPTGPNPEDNAATATPALSTSPSEVSQATEDASLTDASSTTGPEEEAAEKTEEKEKKQENKQGVAQIIFHNKAATSSGSVLSPSVLWAGLTGLLALRL